MGGLYSITYSGTDKIFNTPDDKIISNIYLISSAYEWYIHNTTAKLSLIKSVPDEVVNIFNAQNSITVKEGSTYQELLSYFEFLGMPHDQAVAKAQSSIGIPRDTMIKALDQIQSEIIAQKSAQLIAYEQAIKTATTTDSTLDLNKELQSIATQPITTQIGAVTVKTLGDFSKEFYNLSNTIKDYSVLSNPDNFMTQTISPTQQTTKTVEQPKENIDTSKTQISLPTTTKEISDSLKKLYENNNTKYLILLPVIGLGLGITLYIIKKRKKDNG